MVCSTTILWVFRVVIDSYHFIRYSVAQVASFYPAGKPVELFPFGRRTILFTSKEACDHILADKRHNQRYRARFGQASGLRELGMLHSGVIWNNDMTLWKESRQCFQKGLTTTTFKDVSSGAAQNVDLVMQRVPVESNHTGAIHMMNALRWVTLNFTLANLLGLGYAEDWHEAIVLVEAIVAYFKAWEFYLVRPWWALLVRPWASRGHRNAVAKLHAISEQLVKEYEQKSAEAKEKRSSCCLHHAYKKYEEKMMSRTDLIQLTLEILLAGVDTSSVTMFYCLGYLAEHPYWYAKVQNEVKQANAPTSETPLLHACIKESMRLKPVGPIIMRQAQSDDRVEGIDIKKGDQVIIHLAAMNLHMMERPKVFDPTRFLDKDGTLIPDGRLPFGYYPFGDGPKGCVGRYLAVQEMLPVMRHLLRTRRIFAVNNNQSMNAMATHWDIAQQPQNKEEMFMIVKPMTRRIFFVGPSSTGKTTMVEAMAKKYPKARVYGEIARTILKTHNVTLQDLEQDVARVAWLQKELVQEYAKIERQCDLSNYNAELEFFDRSALDALFFCKHRVSEEAYQDLVKSCDLQDCLSTYRDSENNRVVLFGAVKGFRQEDGVRLVAASHAEHVAEQQAYEAILNDLEIPFTTLTEQDTEERQKRVCDIIHELEQVEAW